MEENRLIPIKDVWLASDRIRFDIPFPSWTESERIGIDLKRTLKLMNLGGIRDTRIEEQKNSHTSQASWVFTGVNPDGSTSAGATATIERVPTFGFENTEIDKKAIFQNAIWTSLRLSLNRKEIEARINLDKKSLKKAESWTPYLDHALRHGIRRSGTNHLLKEHGPFQIAVALYFTIHEVLMDAAKISLWNILFRQFNPHLPSLNEIAYELGINFTALWIAGMLLYGRENKNGTGYRFSLLPGYEVDRAILLQLLSRTLPLIKTIPQEE